MYYDENQLIAVYSTYFDIQFIQFNCDNLIQQCKKPQINFIEKNEYRSEIKSFHFLLLQKCFVVENSGEFNFYCLNQDEKIKVLLDNHEYPVNDMCISNNRNYLASISEKELYVYDQNLKVQHFTQIGGQYIFFSKNDKIFISTHTEIFELNPEQNFNVSFRMQLKFEYGFEKFDTCFFIHSSTMFEYMCNNILSEKLMIQDYNLEKINYDGSKFCILEEEVMNEKQFQVIFFPKNLFRILKYENIINFLYYNNGELIIINTKDTTYFYNQIQNFIYEVNHYQQIAKSFCFINKIKLLIIGFEQHLDIYNCNQLFYSKNQTDKLEKFHEFMFVKSLTNMCVNEKELMIISIHENFIYFWNILEKQQIFSFYAHSKKIQYIISSQDKQTYTTGGDDCKIKIWKVQYSTKLINNIIHFNMITKIQYSNDAKSLSSINKDQSIIVYDLIKKKALQKNDIQNSKILLHSDYLIKSDFLNELQVFGNQDNLLYLQIVKNSELSIRENKIDNIHKNQFKNSKFDELEKSILLANIIISQDGESYIKNQDSHIQHFVIDYFENKYLEIVFVQDFINILQNFDEKDDLNKLRTEIKFSNFSFNQTNSSEYITIAHCKNKQFIISSYIINVNMKVVPQEYYTEVKKVILHNNLLLIQENEQNLKLLERMSSEFKNFRQYKHDQDIISVILNSNFVYFIDKTGILIILNTIELEEIKRMNLGFTFDQDNEVSTSIIFEQFYAVGLMNRKLLIWNFEQEKNQQQFFYNFQLSIKQPITQIQFSTNNYVVGCLCDSFVWFINFISSKTEILRTTYNCYYNFIFCKNIPFILHFNSDQQLVKSHLYNCINYSYFQEKDEIGFRKLSKNQRYLAYHNNAQQLKVYDIKSKFVIKTFPLNKQHISDVIFSIENKRLIILLKQEQKQFIVLWTIANSQNLLQNNIPDEINENISVCEISNDEDYIMIATQDLKLFYISIEMMEIIFSIDDLENLITAIAFSPNKLEFAVGLSDGSLQLYNLNKQQLVSNNQEEKQYTYRPVCTKIFSRLPQLLSCCCQLNQNSKISNEVGQSLVQILIQKQAEINKNEV